MGDNDRNPNYDELQLHAMEQYRRQIRALLAHRQAAHLQTDPWENVPLDLRDHARHLQKVLNEMVLAGYDLYVRPVHGSGSHDDAWRRFVRWRDDMQDRYSRRAFGKRFQELLEQGTYLSVPQDFDEDVQMRKAYSDSLVEEAFQSGALPRKAMIHDPIRRADELQSIGPPYEQIYRDALRSCKWRCVFHVTRLEHLPLIGVFGLMPGRDAVLHSPRTVERKSRRQTNAAKENFAANSVCSSFFPQYWTFDQLGGEENCVIVAINAEVVCLRSGTSFFPQATRNASITVEDHERNRSDTPEGLKAFNSCWDEERPLADGWGPKPENHEIYSRRILPSEIDALIFRTAEARDEWFPIYSKAAQQNYDRVETVAEVESIRLGGRLFEFQSVRKARTQV